MNEQFDKELRNHIKDTFGGFDDHLADDGWRKLNDRKKKKRRAFIFWYILPSGIAASIAFLLFFNLGEDGLIKTDKHTNQEEIVAKNVPSGKSENEKIKVEETKSKAIDLKTESTSKNVEEIAKTKTEEIKKSSIEKIEAPIKSSDKIVQNRIKSIDNSKSVNSNSIPNNLIINKKLITNVSREDFDSKLNSTNSNQLKIQSESVLLAENNKTKVSEPKLDLDSSSNYLRENVGEIYAQERRFLSTESKENQKLNPKSFDQKSVSNIEKLALLNQPKADNKDKKTNKLGKKFKIGIDANTYVNFNENGLNDKLNVGFGLVSEYRLSKKLSINSGITLNSQNSVFNGLQRSSQDFRSFNLATSSFAAVPRAQVTNAKLVGLDIPLTLQYQLQFGKTKSFFSTGFSSYSVINERYNNEFTVINYSFTGVNTSSVSNVIDNPEGRFSYFKFARTLDISFGILYPISKKNTLSIEPFMKYPLSGLGYQNLKIGASGLSFKMNFGK